MSNNTNSDSPIFDSLSREQKLAKAKATLNRFKKEKKDSFLNGSTNQSSMSRSSSGQTDNNSNNFESLKAENIENCNNNTNNNSNFRNNNGNNAEIKIVNITHQIMDDFNFNTSNSQYNNEEKQIKQSNNEELELKIKQYENKINQLEEENSELLREIHDTNKRNRELNEKIVNDQEVLTESLEVLTEQKAEIMEKYKELILNLQEMEKEKSKLSEQSTSMKKAIDDIKEELTTKNQQLNVQRQNIDTLSKEKWMLQEELENTKASINKCIKEAVQKDRDNYLNELKTNENNPANEDNSGNNSYGIFLLQKNYMDMVKENDELKKTCSIYLDNLHKLDEFLLKFSNTNVSVSLANNSYPYRPLPESPNLDDDSNILSPFLNSFIPLTDVMTSSNIKQSYEIFDTIKKRIDYFQKNYNELYKNLKEKESNLVNIRKIMEDLQVKSTEDLGNRIKELKSIESLYYEMLQKQKENELLNNTNCTSDNKNIIYTTNKSNENPKNDNIKQNDNINNEQGQNPSLSDIKTSSSSIEELQPTRKSSKMVQKLLMNLYNEVSEIFQESNQVIIDWQEMCKINKSNSIISENNIKLECEPLASEKIIEKSNNLQKSQNKIIMDQQRLKNDIEKIKQWIAYDDHSFQAEQAENDKIQQIIIQYIEQMDKYIEVLEPFFKKTLEKFEEINSKSTYIPSNIKEDFTAMNMNIHKFTMQNEVIYQQVNDLKNILKNQENENEKNEDDESNISSLSFKLESADKVVYNKIYNTIKLKDNKINRLKKTINEQEELITRCHYALDDMKDIEKEIELLRNAIKNIATKDEVINSMKISSDQTAMYMLKIRNNELYQVYQDEIEINRNLRSYINQVKDEQVNIQTKTQSKILTFENEIENWTRKYNNLYNKTKIYEQKLMNKDKKIQTLTEDFEKYITSIINGNTTKNSLNIQYNEELQKNIINDISRIKQESLEGTVIALLEQISQKDVEINALQVDNMNLIKDIEKIRKEHEISEYKNSQLKNEFKLLKQEYANINSPNSGIFNDLPPIPMSSYTINPNPDLYIKHNYNGINNYKLSPYLSSLYSNSQNKSTVSQQISPRYYNYNQNQQQLNTQKTFKNQEPTLHSYIPPLSSSYVKNDYDLNKIENIESNHHPINIPTSSAVLMQKGQHLSDLTNANAMKLNQLINKSNELNTQPFHSLSNSLKNEKIMVSNNTNNNNKNAPLYISELQNNSSNKLPLINKSSSNKNELLKKASFNVELSSVKANKSNDYSISPNHDLKNLEINRSNSLSNFPNNNKLVMATDKQETTDINPKSSPHISSFPKTKQDSSILNLDKDKDEILDASTLFNQNATKNNLQNNSLLEVQNNEFDYSNSNNINYNTVDLTTINNQNNNSNVNSYNNNSNQSYQTYQKPYLYNNTDTMSPNSSINFENDLNKPIIQDKRNPRLYESLQNVNPLQPLSTTNQSQNKEIMSLNDNTNNKSQINKLSLYSLIQ
ncbi:hypothetical protein BCR36DRAFT_346560 [Piromyces finnis]|uniref:Uncharacterized protein n=1 Tax=Piromyces finnis TaxID=1754191 RepID=A0A1Y1VH42_9FUNG|nr:hypothetical protein BCR36DRAFT_346560 [Piromyces finnis]|eukprot:ORX56029.1 hypothetical protein BCR36DRAFT_346560 [Piromyces finnis]